MDGAAYLFFFASVNGYINTSLFAQSSQKGYHSLRAVPRRLLPSPRTIPTRH